MRPHRVLVLVLIAATALATFSTHAAVDVEDGWFIVDGERFFVKGIGYTVASGRGSIPWE